MTWKIFLRLRYVQLHMHWEQTHSTACESCESFQSSWKKSSGHSKTNPSSTSPRSSHILDSPRGHWWSQPHGRERGIWSFWSFWSCDLQAKMQLFWQQEDHPHSIEQGGQWCYMVLLYSSVKALQCLQLCGFKDYHLRVWSDTGTDANHYIQYTSPSACANWSLLSCWFMGDLTTSSHTQWVDLRESSWNVTLNHRDFTPKLTEASTSWSLPNSSNSSNIIIFQV